MRVLIAGSTYYPGSNGQAVFSIHLAEGLARAGNQVMMVTPATRMRSGSSRVNGVLLQERGSLPLVVHPDAFFTLPVDFALAQIVDRFRPQVIHIQDHYPLSWVAAGIARRRGLPIIGTNHFLPENVLPYLQRFVPLRRNQLIRLLWWTMLSLYNQLDLVTTPTETAAKILRQQKIRPQVVPVSCGVDTIRFHPDPGLDRDAVRRQYGLDPNRSLFLYVGRLDREKRLDVLLHAFACLGRDGARLVIGGTGAEAGALVSLARHLRIEERVVFTGYIPHDDLPRLLNSVDFFCMPSPEELQSIATLEAMTSGLPVLAARARALPELVEHRVNGYLFNPDDAGDAALGMAYLLDAGSHRGAMRQASLARVRPHSLENTIRRYEDLYRSLLPEVEMPAEQAVLAHEASI